MTKKKKASPKKKASKNTKVCSNNKSCKNKKCNREKVCGDPSPVVPDSLMNEGTYPRLFSQPDSLWTKFKKLIRLP